jgi:radical SAM family protein
MTTMGEPDSITNIAAAGLLLTTWCNARCAHCYELSHPGRRLWMDQADARRHLSSLASLGVPASGVHIGGGEPFGDYPRLLSVVRAARGVGLAGVGYVETNGYWATSDAIAATRLAELREAGMQQISISADVFHQSWVDPVCVQRLHRVAVDVLGSGGVRARRWKFLQNPIDLRQADEATRRECYREALRAHGERMTGRAARVLADLVPRHPASAYAETACRESLVAGGHVHIDPKGHVFPGTCSGLLLGQATEALPLEDVLLQPPGPVRRALVAGGPVALMRLAEAEGYTQRDGGYAGKCHLCTDVRTFLFTRHHHVGEVGPREMVEDE